MEWLFRRHFWIVELAFVALAAIILAFALNKIIGYRLISQSASQANLGAQRPQPRLTGRNFDAANERNLFNAKREKTEVSPSEGNCDHFWESEETSQRIRLVGTAVFANEADSLAYVETSRQPNASAQAYSVNDCDSSAGGNLSFGDEDLDSKLAPEACNQIPSVGEIQRIESECVYFYSTSSRRCEFMRISPFSVCNEQGDFRPRPSMPESTPAPMPSVTPEDPGESIKKIGATTYEIERGDLDGLLNNLGQILTQARVIPETVDGKTAFRFVSIQPDSFFEKIGFKVGDVVTKINGFEVSIEKASEFLAKLRTDSQFNVEGKRDGGTFSYDYNVRR